MSNNKKYISPKIREIVVNAGQVLCGSSQTEGFVISDNRYEDDDWE